MLHTGRPEIKANSAATIAQHYRPGARPESGYFKIPCPAHQGEGENLHLADALDGGLVLKCWSAECTYNQILSAFQADGLAVHREWTYPNGKVVIRWDRGGAKNIKSIGKNHRVPLLITNDSPGALIVIVEGESDRDAVLSAGLQDVAAATFVGGSKVASRSDYSAVKGRMVAIWADHDREGAAATIAAAQACQAAGASSVATIPLVGPPDSGCGAADLTPDTVGVFIKGRKPWAGPGPEQAGEGVDLPPDDDGQPQPFRLVWRDMADVVDLPPVKWILPGVLASASVCMLTGATKAGKTLFVLALLKAATTGLPFLGYTIPMMRGWYLTEMTDYVLKAQLGIIDWMPPPGLFPTAYKNEQDFLEMTPRALADGLLWDYDAALTSDRAPKLIIIDTLGRWLRGFDFNDYSQVTSATEPILQAASDLKRDGVSFLLLHHQRKGGGPRTESSLGSQALSGSVDTHCGLTLKSVDSEIRQLSIQSRLGLGDLGSYVEIELALPAGEYRVVADESENVEAAVVEYLTDHTDGASPKALREALEINDRHQMARACTALVESGVLASTGKANATRYFMAGQVAQLSQDFVAES